MLFSLLYCSPEIQQHNHDYIHSNLVIRTSASCLMDIELLFCVFVLGLEDYTNVILIYHTNKKTAMYDFVAVVSIKLLLP